MNMNTERIYLSFSGSGSGSLSLLCLLTPSLSFHLPYFHSYILSLFLVTSIFHKHRMLVYTIAFAPIKYAFDDNLCYHRYSCGRHFIIVVLWFYPFVYDLSLFWKPKNLYHPFFLLKESN